MIKNIFELLKCDLLEETELIKIAKGKYKIPTTIKQAIKKIKEDGARHRG
jgi:hypothetical protein